MKKPLTAVMKPYYLSRNNVTTALGNLITLLGNKVADVGQMSFSTEVIRFSRSNVIARGYNSNQTVENDGNPVCEVLHKYLVQCFTSILCNASQASCATLHTTYLRSVRGHVIASFYYRNQTIANDVKNIYLCGGKNSWQCSTRSINVFILACESCFKGWYNKYW
jgi:hypothetical protein